MVLKQVPVTPDVSIFYQYLVKEKAKSPFNQAVKYATSAALSFVVCSLLSCSLLNVGFPNWDDCGIITVVHNCPL